VVNAKLPIKNLADYVRYAKDSKDGITFASSGSGSSIHLSGEMFKMQSKLKMLHVPYRGSAPAVTDLLAFYLAQPLTAMLSAALLLYSPALLDILPIYIVFMVVSPLVIMHGRRGAWGWMLGLSLALWFGAQFGLGPLLHGALQRVVALPVRYQDMGAFEILAWQFLWMLGLWMGATRHEAGQKPMPPIPHWMLLLALFMALYWWLDARHRFRDRGHVRRVRVRGERRRRSVRPHLRRRRDAGGHLDSVG